jgi:hypothetical protein
VENLVFKPFSNFTVGEIVYKNQDVVLKRDWRKKPTVFFDPVKRVKME